MLHSSAFRNHNNAVVNRCEIFTYAALIVYLIFIGFLLGVNIPEDTDGACLVVLETNASIAQICCISWWVAALIGLPSASVCLLILCKRSLLAIPFVYNAIILWLCVTVAYGDYLLFTPSEWCTNKLLSLFMASLLFQNNMLLLMLLCASVWVQCATCQGERRTASLRLAQDDAETP